MEHSVTSLNFFDRLQDQGTYFKLL
jgi:hypothetical protein